MIVKRRKNHSTSDTLRPKLPEEDRFAGRTVLRGIVERISAGTIRSRINRDGIARQHLDRLRRKGADEDVLVGMLVNLGKFSRSRNAFEINTDGLDRRQVRAAAKKIREAADLMRRTRWLLHTKDLSLKDHLSLEGPPPASPETLDEFRGLPKRVLWFADGLERGLRRHDLSPNAPSLWDSALVMLIVYLKKTTGKYQHKAICELLTAGVNLVMDEYVLNQWHYRHKELIKARLDFKPRFTT